MGLTSRLKLPWGDLGDGADIEEATRPLAESLDKAMLVDTSTSQPPDPGTYPPGTFPPAGCLYLRIMGPGITPRLYISDGTAWMRLGIQGGAAPVGALMAWSASLTTPNDPDVLATWHLCDGHPLVRADYPEFSAVVGSAWGGNPTNVNVPNMCGKTLVGADRGHGQIVAPNPNTLGTAGGAQKHQLVATEQATMPVSNGTGNGVSATGSASGTGSPHLYYEAAGSFAGTELRAWGGAIPGAPPTPHNNLQPYAVVDWYIRVK